MRLPSNILIHFYIIFLSFSFWWRSYSTFSSTRRSCTTPEKRWKACPNPQQSFAQHVKTVSFTPALSITGPSAAISLLQNKSLSFLHNSEREFDDLPILLLSDEESKDSNKREPQVLVHFLDFGTWHRFHHSMFAVILWSTFVTPVNETISFWRKNKRSFLQLSVMSDVRPWY